MTVRRWLAVILLVTVLGRVAFILLFDHTLSLQTSGYDAYAVNLIEGRGYTRFDDRSASSWHTGYSWNFPKTRLVHVDIDPAEILQHLRGRHSIFAWIALVRAI